MIISHAIRVSVALFTLAIPALMARDFYSSPEAGQNGDGSYGQPMAISKFLSGEILAPGDTLWLRGGIYNGPFISRIKGTDGTPVIVRSYPGERVRISGNGSHASAFAVQGDWAWFHGLEIDNSAANGQAMAPAVTVDASHTRFLNMAVHNAATGFELRPGISDVELYGNLVYETGLAESGLQTSAGIAVPQDGANLRILANIVFNQRLRGIVVYSTGNAEKGDLTLERNVLFDNGLAALGSTPGNLQFLGQLNGRASISGNYTFESASGNGGENVLSAGSGCRNMTIRGNYLVGRVALSVAACAAALVEANTLHGSASGWDLHQYPENTYVTARPNNVDVFVEKDAYNAGRAEVVVYNWQAAPAVSVDLSGVLTEGQRFESTLR